MFAGVCHRRESGAVLEDAAELGCGTVAAEIAHRTHGKRPLPQQFLGMRDANGLDFLENRMADLLREPQIGQRARTAHHAHDVWHRDAVARMLADVLDGGGDASVDKAARRRPAHDSHRADGIDAGRRTAAALHHRRQKPRRRLSDTFAIKRDTGKGNGQRFALPDIVVDADDGNILRHGKPRLERRDDDASGNPVVRGKHAARQGQRSQPPRQIVHSLAAG